MALSSELQEELQKRSVTANVTQNVDILPEKQADLSSKRNVTRDKRYSSESQASESQANAKQAYNVILHIV